MDKREAEEKLNEFDKEMREKESVKEVGLWRMIIMSPWNFYFAIYNNLPLGKRTGITVKFFAIKLIEFLLVVEILLIVNILLR